MLFQGGGFLARRQDDVLTIHSALTLAFPLVSSIRSLPVPNGSCSFILWMFMKSMRIFISFYTDIQLTAYRCGGVGRREASGEESRAGAACTLSSSPASDGLAYLSVIQVAVSAAAENARRSGRRSSAGGAAREERREIEGVASA